MSRTLPKILAVDDDVTWLEQIQIILEDDAEVHLASTIDTGISKIEQTFFDIILLDLNFEGDSRSGLDIFYKIAAVDQGPDVIVISAETRPPKIVQICNAGVTHFVEKQEAKPDRIRSVVRDIIQKRELRLRAFSSGLKSKMDILGSSHLAKKLRSDVQEVADAGIKDILLLGETGAGKEIVARSIANLADPAKRMIPIHCGAITDSLTEAELFGYSKGAFTGAMKDRASPFEVAGGGYVFFDEIGDMPVNQQVKLLRVIQERKVVRVGETFERIANFRTISATNKNLEEAIAKKEFREDLYFRISKAVIKIPSLRDRAEDIPEIVNFFLGKNSQKKTLTDAAMDVLRTYHWPGNVRQLEAVIEGLCFKIKDSVIREKDIIQAIPQAVSRSKNRPMSFFGSTGAALLSAEREKFERALKETKGNRTEAARKLEMSRATFFRRAKELGLVRERHGFS